MKELTNLEILQRATNSKFDNNLIFGRVSNYVKSSANDTKAKNIFIIEIKRMFKSAYILSLTKGVYYMSKGKDHTLLLEPTDLLNLRKLKDAQTIARTIASSDIIS